MTSFAPPISQVAPNLVTRLPEGTFASQSKGVGIAGAGLLLLSLIVGFAGSASDQFLFSYLTAYMWALSIVLGSLFFVMVQHLARAGWSVVVRRVAEQVMGLMPFMAILFLPIAIGYHTLYHHWVDASPDDVVLAEKRGYLNVTFFFVRAVVYFAIWIGLARWFKRTSLRQDESGDPALTLRMARVAAPAMLLFALSVTFAAVDWIMTLDPHWFSTIFGVCYFAGGFMSAMAVLGLLCLWIQGRGYLREAVTVEHFHDIGKLLFAFMVFWTYVNFSQYMLIWYANLPEETAFYAHRQHGTWVWVGRLLIVGHFLLPFAYLMSRHIKRSRKALAAGAVFLLVMHWFDMLYLVMPNFAAREHDVHFHWLDFTCIAGMACLMFGLAVGGLRRSPLLPERDPRLAESLHFHNI